MRKIILTLLVPFLIIGLAGPAFAALQAVSSGIHLANPPAALVPAPVPPNLTDLVTGYPPWYMDTTGLKLELCSDSETHCLLVPLVEGGIDPILGVGGETFWWESGAIVPVPAGGALAGAGQAQLVLAMEAAFANEDPIADQQVSFGRVRIRVDVPVPGTYTVTHPFGVQTFTVNPGDILPPDADGIRGINFTEDIPFPFTGFDGALGSGIGPFLFWDSQLPVIDPAGPALDNFYIGDPLVAHSFLGSPFGTNFFRVEGPAGSNLGGPGIDFVETNQFNVMGKVFTNGGLANTPPTPVLDDAVTLTDTAVMIDVLANDTFADIPINPTSIAITQGTLGTAAMEVVNGKVMVNYTPNPGVSGPDTFTYVVANFAGTASPAATVNVMVEDLKVAKAEIRPKFLKWRIEGTSSDTIDNTITLYTGTGTLNTVLTGAAEVPPVTTGATGSGSVTINAAGTAIDFNLSVANILNVTAAHIHVGEVGVNGPIILPLAASGFTSLTGTLTAADLVPSAAQGINTFEDAVEAIQAGRAYFNVHTSANLGGEIRGQLGPVGLIGSATVAGDGSWSFTGKSKALPGQGAITIRSSNGVTIPDLPLMIK